MEGRLAHMEEGSGEGVQPRAPGEAVSRRRLPGARLSPCSICEPGCGVPVGPGWFTLCLRLWGQAALQQVHSKVIKIVQVDKTCVI